MVGVRLNRGARRLTTWSNCNRVLRLPMDFAGDITARVGAILVLALFGATPLLAAMPQAGAPVRAVVEEQVYTQLSESPDGKAYVIVLLRAPRAGGSLEAAKAVVKQVQERVLANLTADEVSVAYRYDVVPAITGRVTASGLAKLAADPNVVSIGPDGRGEAHLNVSVPFINADDVQAMGYTGAGITVAVLDTGIDSNHPNLSDDLAAGWYHFLDQGVTVGPGAEDDNGHGTNVSGIITSKGVAPCSIGVAPDADILAIKVLKADGSGWVSDWVAGINYVVANIGNYAKLPVINMSLGTYDLYTACPCDNMSTYTQAMQAALLAAKNAGIVTFASSGNQGHCDRMSAPACLSAATAVAAVYDQNLGREPDSGTYQSLFGGSWPACYDATTAGDKVTCFSNRSMCNSLAAPGRLIAAPGMGGGVSTYTGTSQAAPHAAGVAALMWQKAAAYGGWWLTPDALVAYMKRTGAYIDDACPTPPYGNPDPRRVDALAAVNVVCPEPGDAVVCEAQGGINPTHPNTYWYDVTPPDLGRCDFHVRVYDSNPVNYSNWSLPAVTWQFIVHQVGSDWWASWWDPGCTNAVFATFRFQFDNPNPGTWGDWTTTIGASSDPYTQLIDTSACHSDEPDGSGYRVHVPTTALPKWEQPPDIWSTGVDVYAQSSPGPPPIVVADDFLCAVTGPITEIDVWGSWWHDGLPAGGPANVLFILSIHADIPAQPPEIPYSRPGDLLWTHYFPPGSFQAELYAADLYEGFYFPAAEIYEPYGDSMCWLYRFHIPEGAEFIQHGSPGHPVVYWLDVQAIPQQEAYFGWKTTHPEYHWNDDAVWTTGEEPAQGPWYELLYPPGHPFAGMSMDMAFRIFGRSEVMPPDPPTPPGGEPGFDKVRHISFVPGNPGVQTALRVTLGDLPPPFEGDEGCRLWVAEPGDVSEVAGKPDATPPTFKRSRLASEASRHCMDWSTVAVLHVTDNEIVPRGAYDVQIIDCANDPSNEAYYSDPLTIATSKWGDIVGDNNVQPPNGVVDFNDIVSVVDKFKNLPGAPIKSRADVSPDVPDKIIDFGDIPSVVDAFKGLPYPYGGPDECP